MHSTQARPGLPVRIALIGAGAISRLHFPAFRDRPDLLRLAAVCEKSHAAADSFVRQFSYPVPIFADLAALLRARDFDAALVALPHHLHFPVASELIKAGVPVLVEKPLTASLEEARALRDLSTAQGVPVVAGQMLRFAPEVVWLRNWIREDAGNFGLLRTFDIQSWQNILAYVTRAGGLNHWLLDGKLAGGGVVVSLAVHQLDLIRFISGDDFTEVTAWGRFDPPFHDGAESCALALMKMSRGAGGVLHATYTGPRVPYCEALTMFGEKGTITQHVHSIGQYRGVLRYATTANQQTQNWSDQFDGFKPVSLAPNADESPDPFVNQLVHFARGLSGEEEFRNTVFENFNTLACIDAIYTSLKTGQPCPVAQC